jgi:WD40 repeat protein
MTTKLLALSWSTSPRAVSAFSPDGQIIAASTSSAHGSSAVIRLFRLRDKKEIQTIETQSGGAALTFTPSGTQLVAGLGGLGVFCAGRAALPQGEDVNSALRPSIPAPRRSVEVLRWDERLVQRRRHFHLPGTQACLRPTSGGTVERLGLL